MTLTPAYGRDYKNKKTVQSDLDHDKDFVIADLMHPDSGRYVNRADLAKTGTVSVMIRYKRLAMIGNFKVKTEVSA